MRNEAKRNGIIIGALLITIALMTIGYAALATQLTITSTVGTGDSSWNIEFESITKNTTLSTTGATEKSIPTASGTAATFNVELTKPGERMVYDLVVANNGTIDASLKEVAGIDGLNTSEPTAITYTVQRLDSADGNVVNTTGDLLSQGKNYFRITIEWTGEASETPTETKSKTGTISLDYSQKTS